jgi:DNA-binding NarL/FixJ family response regulator
MNEKIKVTCIDDHKIVKEGINFLLSQYPFIDIIQNDFNDIKIDDLIFRSKIDVVILDLHLEIFKGKKILNGYDVCEGILAKYPDIKIIGHSMYDNVENVNKLFYKGAMGFVSKKSGHEELANAIKRVHGGNIYICNEVIKKTKNSGKFIEQTDDVLKAIVEPFTKAERSVLEKIAKGFSTKQIAQQLDISEKTVETHRKHLFDKTGVKNVAELISYIYSRRIFID